MSNISTIEAKPVKATLSRSAAVSERPVVAPRPQVAVKVRLVSYPQKRRKAQARRIESVVCHGLLLGVMMIITYGVSSIAGQVMVEESRKDNVKTQIANVAAVRTERKLRSYVSNLTDPQSISNWAQDHQFTNAGVPAKQPAKTDGMLALRD